LPVTIMEASPPITHSLPFERWLRPALHAVLLVTAVGIGVFWWQLKPGTWTRLASFRWQYLPVLAAMIGLAWACNGFRTWLLARVLGHKIAVKDAIAVTLSTEFASAATPGGVGGLVARLALQRRLGIPSADTLAMLAADVAIDLSFFAALTPLALWRGMRLLSKMADESMESSIAPMLAVVALGSLVAGLALWRWAVRRRQQKGRPSTWRQRLASGFGDFKNNLGVFWRRGWLALALTFIVAAVQWICRYGVLPVVLLGFGVSVDPVPLMLLQGVLFFVAVAIAVPGGGGSIEVLSSVILPLMVPALIIGPVVLIWRLFTYHLYLLGGGLTLWHLLRKSPPDASIEEPVEAPGAASLPFRSQP